MRPTARRTSPGVTPCWRRPHDAVAGLRSPGDVKRVDDQRARVAAAPPGPQRAVLLRELVAGAARWPDPRGRTPPVVAVRHRRPDARLGQVPFHAQARVSSLCPMRSALKGLARRGIQVAQPLHPGLTMKAMSVPRGAQRRGRGRTPARGSSRPGCRRWELRRVGGVVEAADVDDAPADRRAVPADVLGRRVHDDVHP